MTKIRPWYVLVFSIIIALAPWGNSLSSWGDLIQIKVVFAALGIVAGVVLAWLGQSPLPPK